MANVNNSVKTALLDLYKHFKNHLYTYNNYSNLNHKSKVNLSNKQVK